MSEDEFTAAPEAEGPGPGGNRMFMMIAGALGLFMVLGLLGLAALFLTRGNTPATNTPNNVNATATADGAALQTAVALETLNAVVPTGTPRPTQTATVRATNTRIIFSTPTRVGGGTTGGSPTPVIQSPTPLPSPTRSGGVVVTPTRQGGGGNTGGGGGSVPNTGFADEFAPFLLAAAGLVAVLFVARKLRSA